MPPEPLWPFFFEVNILQRKARHERTVFATLDGDGRSHWVDHSGRMTRRGGFGGISFGPGGEIRHDRGGQEISPEAEAAEKEEFTIKVDIAPADFRPIRTVIERVGKPWMSGWSRQDSEVLHGLLEGIYWKHVNRHVLDPFDPTDA